MFQLPFIRQDFLLFLSSSTSVNSGVDHRRPFAASLAASASACCLYIASPELHGSLRQRIGPWPLIASGVITLQRFLQIADGRLSNGAAFALLDLSRPCFRPAPSRWNAPAHRHGFLASTASRRFLSSAALASASLDHLLDVGLGQTAGGLDADLLLLARSPCPLPTR